jgi:hypothetical protein
MRRETWNYIGLMIVAVIILIFFVATKSYAFDSEKYMNVDPNVRQWFKNQRSPHGVPCCDVADGHQTEYDMRPDNHYWVPIEGEWRQVPSEAVIYNAGNPVGEAIVWYVRQGPDAVYIRCFVPGGGV